MACVEVPLILPLIQSMQNQEEKPRKTRKDAEKDTISKLDSALFRIFRGEFFDLCNTVTNLNMTLLDFFSPISELFSPKSELFSPMPK
jgi:hypothetical protein